MSDANGHTPHDCRYTFAYLMEHFGVSLLKTQKILGHKLNNVTEDIYINPTDEELVEAINKIDLKNI